MNINAFRLKAGPTKGRDHTCSRFKIVVSVPLVVEYEAARLEHRPANVSPSDVAVVLDYVCSEAHEQEFHYLWQPLLRDPKDDMVLEVAVAGGCDTIVTYNIGDFGGAQQFEHGLPLSAAKAR
jgi:predicted nucleic acid-binding protein